MITKTKNMFKSLSETSQFLTTVTGSLLAGMAAAVLLAAIFYPNEKVVGNLGLYYLKTLPGFVFYTLIIRGIVGVALGSLLSYVMMKALGVNTWAELTSKFQMAHNSSHITLIEGFFIGSMFLAAAMPLTDPFAYLLNIMFRGGTSILVATGLILLCARLMGVTTLAEYRKWIDAMSNDDYAKMVRALFIGLMFLTTMAGK